MAQDLKIFPDFRFHDEAIPQKHQEVSQKGLDNFFKLISKDNALISYEVLESDVSDKTNEYNLYGAGDDGFDRFGDYPFLY